MDKPSYVDADERHIYDDENMDEQGELMLVALIPEEWDYPYMG